MNPFQLLEIVFREETLLNAVKSVTRNGRSIVYTSILAFILVYLFSIVGYSLFSDDFVIKEKKSSIRACDTLLMCIVTSLNYGLRNGGGIGDVLRKPSLLEPSYYSARVIYDLLFFFVIIIIVMNLIFCVIVDTFADLRLEKQSKENILKSTCFICGLDRSAFYNKTVSFEEHIKKSHNMWHYFYFIAHLNVKNATEYTGPESYVHEMILMNNLEWFPRQRTSSLNEDENSNSIGFGEEFHNKIDMQQMKKILEECRQILGKQTRNQSVSYELLFFCVSLTNLRFFQIEHVRRSWVFPKRSSTLANLNF